MNENKQNKENEKNTLQNYIYIPFRGKYGKIFLTSLAITLASITGCSINNKTPLNETYKEAQELKSQIHRYNNRTIHVTINSDMNYMTEQINNLREKQEKKQERLEELVRTTQYQEAKEKKEQRKKTNKYFFNLSLLGISGILHSIRQYTHHIRQHTYQENQKELEKN